MAQIFIDWSQIIDPFAFPTTQTTTQLVLNNVDGLTQTVINGTGFTYDSNGFPTGGAISDISLVVIANSAVLQTLTNVDPTALADVGTFASQAFDLRTQINWLGVISQNAEPIVLTATEIRLLNTDGTFTVVTGSGFSVTGQNLTGTVSAIRLFDTDGVTVLDNGPVTGLPVSLALGASAIIDEARSAQTYLIANQGDNTLTSVANEVVSGPDTFFNTLKDGPGSDTINDGGPQLNPPMISWELSTDPITLNLATGTVTSAAGNDTITGLPVGGNVQG